jgi:hypothetical protein
MANKKTAVLLSFVVTLLIIIFYYHKILFNPQSYLTSDSGDGMKAFFVFADHIKNDASYHQLVNMNYPYGQTHVFTDGQTIIADTFKFLGKYFPFFITHCMALYNLMMLLSFPFCALLMCSIINRLNMPAFFSVFGSVVITLLSPQIFRMFGHPTLSYVLFFPLAWWLFIKFNESENRKHLWSVIIGANSIFWFFVHPYYIMICSFFFVAYWFVGFIQSNSKMQFSKSILLPLTIQVIAPLLITRMYIHVEDIHSFRSESPWGFWNYYASWNTVFMPNHYPFNPVYNYFFEGKGQNWEGWAYIGLPAVIVTLFVIIKIIRYCINKKFKLILKPVLPPVLKTSVWAAYLVLLFSMCLPFQLNMRFLVDWLPFLKQFRSLGRFAWVFYYVFTTFALYITFLAYRYLRMKKLSLTAYSLVILYFSIYIAEAIPYHSEGRENATRSINYFASNNLPDDYGELIAEIEKVKDRYQCIIPMPFYHVGSENFGKESTSSAMRSSMVVSYWNNIPILASSAARSPILEAKNIMQFFSPPWFKKTIEKDLPSKKDFLILFTKEDVSPKEKEWLDKANKIFSNDNFELWSLPYEKVFISNAQEIVNKFNSQKDSLLQMNGFYLTQKNDTLIYRSFDEQQSNFIYKGKGALKSSKKSYTMLLEKGHYNLKSDHDYIVSFWYYNKDELRNQISCVFEQCDSSGNNCKWDIMWSPAESMVIDGDWSLVEKKIHINNSNNQFSIFLKGDDHSGQEIFVDEFLLRSENEDIYKLTAADSVLNYNNLNIHY